MAFQSVFGRNNDIILSMCTELEPLRNSIAHNRTVSPASVNIIENATQRLRTALGTHRFDAMVARSTVAPNVYDILCSLRAEGKVASDRIRQCERCVVLEVWPKVEGQWWFEDGYLGTDLEPVRAFFGLAQEYCALPRSMGDGYRVERWLAERGFEQLAASMRTAWDPLKIPDPTV